MTDIQTIAQTAADRHDLDYDTALDQARTYARQVAAFDRITLDEDDIPDEQAGYILGAIAAAHETLTPALLDDITEHADDLTQHEAQATTSRQLRDRAILAAADAGHTRPEISAAAGLSLPAVGKILEQQRKAR